MTDPALVLRGVSLLEGATVVLSDLDWEVRSDERWIVLGPNGSGKSSLIRLASLYRHPSSGELEVLGERLGSCDVRRLRTRIGLAGPVLSDQLRPGLTATEVVLTGREAALEPWWHAYGEGDRADARAELDRWRLGHRREHALGTLSAGERQRLLLARAFAFDPGLVLLDEPTAGLDLPGREDLVSLLGLRASDPGSPPVVLVTHHVEEIPTGFTHALLVRAGRVARAGPLAEVVTSDALSGLFERALEVEERDGRYRIWSV